MKTKIALIVTFLLIILTLQVNGQESRERTQTAMLGEPTFEKTSEGLNIKVWIIPQKDTDKMVMRDETTDEIEAGHTQKTDTATERESGRIAMGSMKEQQVTVGTHHVMLEINDTEDNKTLDNANPQLVLVTPSKTSNSIELESMMKHFGGNITLDQKGQYELSTIITFGGTARTVNFPFTLK